MYTNALIKIIYNVHNKTHAKFQIDQNKGGVVLTKYPLIVQNAEKVRKLKNDDNAQTTSISSDHVQNICKVSKRSE